MSDLEEALYMLNIAERDRRALGGMSDAAVFADEVFGFHAQQAVEKALKAWLCRRGQHYPFTHDLKLLLTLLDDLGEDTSRFRHVVDLTAFAVMLRYAGAHEGLETLDRKETLRRVEQVFDHVRGMMTGE